jgi:cell division protein FtsL
MEKQEPQIKFEDPIDAINKKLDKFFWILFSVGFVFVVTLIVMVITLLIDSSHFNSAVYKEYSQKTESVETTQKTNEALLKQIQDLSEQNMKDREIIKELLKK